MPADTPRRVSVQPLLPLPGPYEYRDESNTLEVGEIVEIPLGPRQVVGVVVGEGPGVVAAHQLKPVLRRLDAPSVPAVSRAFADWVAAYTLSSPGAVMKMVVGGRDTIRPPAPVPAFRIRDAGVGPAAKLTALRSRVLACLEDGEARAAADISAATGASAAVLRAMVAAGLLERIEMPVRPQIDLPDPDRAPVVAFNPAQRRAVEHLIAAVRRDRFSVTVIDGVTGSGKTDVYFEAVAEVLRAGRQVLILVPEIALSVPFLDRFAARFGVRPLVWHSDLTVARRRAVWRAVAEGGAAALIGARSALFLPYADLGLIVVDEEHEAAYKQEDGVIYQGRDMAVARARLGRIPATLVSATPSLETVVNIRRGRYGRVALPSRIGASRLPDVELLDMRAEGPDRGSWIAPRLVEAVRAARAAGEQSLLFLNRRGYAPLTLCRTCGWRGACDRCSAWLVEHRLTGRLQCHHCGASRDLPDACPDCGTRNSLVAVGPGVEQLLAESTVLFPGAETVIASSDTLSGPGAAREFVQSVLAGKIDIIIGTQVVAKGHHFPRLTTVGVIDADLGLSGGDLRASERTYHMLHQVAGRAGREDRPGRVWLQTFQPESPVMQALAHWDRDGFVTAEARERQAADMPPFGQLAALVVSSRNPVLADRAAGVMARAAPHYADLRVLGPAPAPLALLRDRHRRRFLVKAAREVDVQQVVRAWLEPLRLPSAVRVSIDVDPYSFL